MSEDLETLLRDAGRGPTTDLDVARVHAAGRRRARGRMAAQGVGALALLGAVAVGVSSLAPVTPSIEPIAPTPVVEATPGGAVVATGDPLAPSVLAGRYAAAVATLEWNADEAMFLVVRTSPDGDVAQETFAPGGVLADPIVADDGTIWALAASNSLVRQAPGREIEEVLQTGEPSGWMPIGFTDDGGVFVVRLATGGVPLEGDGGVSVLYPDGTLLDDYPGVDAAGISGEGGSIHAAAAIAEHMVVLHTGLADGTFATLAPSGQEPRALVPSPSSEIADLTHVAFAGSEAWIVEQRYDAGGGGVDLLFVDVLDPDAPVRRVATPVGRDFEGRVTGIDVAPDDDAIILQLHDTDGVRLEPLLIDVVAARSVAAVDTGESATDASGDGSPFARIATDGIVALTAGDGTGPSPDAAACASDDDRVNAPAENEIGVWLTCWDAFEGGTTGYYEAWWRADRFQAANLAAGPDGMRAILQAWLDGPTDAEAARGVTAAGHAGTITIGDIRVDGATVTVELDADGEGGGIPSGTGDGSAWRGAAAAALLQLPAVEAVVLVTDGVCGYWEGGADGDDCITWTDADLPWARGANSECAKQPAQVNLRPGGGGGANLWFFCSGANERLGDGVLMPWWRVDDPWPGASLPSDPAARTRFAIEQWVEGPTVEQQALGLSGGLEVGVTLAGVSFEGSRVLIDLAVTTAGVGEFAYEPNWSTSYESIYWATAFASIALQLPEFDELQFTTNSRCEDFALMSEVVPCWVYTDEDAAWNQAG